MATTYEPIATTTLGSISSSVTFSSIPSTYTDLYVVSIFTSASTGVSLRMQYNSDTGNNYSTTSIAGSGSAATSSRETGTTSIYLGFLNSTSPMQTRTQIQNYSNSTTFKTSLNRKDQSDTFVEGNVGLWRNTAAITQINLSGISFAVGSTFTLYGIKAA